MILEGWKPKERI